MPMTLEFHCVMGYNFLPLNMLQCLTPCFPLVSLLAFHVIKESLLNNSASSLPTTMFCQIVLLREISKLVPTQITTFLSSLQHFLGLEILIRYSPQLTHTYAYNTETSSRRTSLIKKTEYVFFLFVLFLFTSQSFVIWNIATTVPLN
jgi:hypothetical protein